MNATTGAALRRGAGVLLALGLLSGCGAGGGADQAGGGATEEERIEAAQLEFSQCMRDNGVDMADPGKEETAELQLDDTAEKALEVCEKEVPMDEFAPSEEEAAEMHERDLELADCLRGEGIDVEDPKKDEGLTLPADADGIEEAMEECGGQSMGRTGAGGGQ